MAETKVRRERIPAVRAVRLEASLGVVDELAKEGYDYDVEFAVGLDVLLDGVEALRSSWREA